jgi:multisubunit Na+/H+ antiporter MnhB subunit
MLILAGIVSTALVGLIAYFAISKQTSRPIRIAAIIALIVIGAAIVCCAILIALLPGASNAGEAIYTDTPIVPQYQTENQNFIPILIFAVIVILMITLIILMSFRAQKRIQERLQAAKHTRHE